MARFPRSAANVFRFSWTLAMAGLIGSCASVETAGPPRTNQPAPRQPNIGNDSGLRQQLPPPRTVYRNVKDTPETGRYYQSARQMYDRGQKRDAMPLIQKYVDTQPNGQFADEGNFLIAKEAYEANNFDGAAKAYRKVVMMNPPSRLRGDAIYFEALCMNNIGKRREALADLAQLDFHEVTLAQRPKVFPFWGKIASDEGRWLEATLAFIKARKETNDPVQKSEMEKLVSDQIDNRLNEAELNFVLQEYPVDFPNALVQLRLANLKLARGEKTQAMDMANTVLQTAPKGSVGSAKAQQFVARIKTLGDATPTRIGVLLPLSGKRESQGRAVVDGLELAIKSAPNNGGIELVMADSGPTNDTALKAFERLVMEEKAIAVIGPQAGDPAEATAIRASEYGVPYIALSPRPGLLQKSNYIFRLALTPERQVSGLVAYAREKLNAHRFAVIFPEDGFGKEFASEYIQAVENQGGVVTAIESYNPKQSDFKIQIENMVGLGFDNFRRKEFAEITDDLEKKLGHKPSPKEVEMALNKPIVDFDVLFIPDTYKAVGQIVPALLYNDVNSVQLMGPSSWNNPELINRAGQYLDNALFVDVFSPERQSPVTQEFSDKYLKKFGSYPSSLTAQGYDVGKALVMAYARGGAPRDREDLRERLEHLGSFDGAMGLQNWDEKREALSELQLYEIKKNKFNHIGGIKLKQR